MKTLLLASLLVLAAPAALAQKADEKPGDRALVAAEHPFVGTWDYVVRPDDPVAEGTFTIAPDGDALGGLFMTDSGRPIDPFEPEGDAIAFTFKQPGMGEIAIRGTLSGDRFEGEAQPEGQDALPFVATRQTAEPASSQ
jgi:hypothetical protein